MLAPSPGPLGVEILPRGPAPARAPLVTGGLVYPGDQRVTLPVEKSFVFSPNPPPQCCLSLGARQVLPSCPGVAPR